MGLYLLLFLAVEPHLGFRPCANCHSLYEFICASVLLCLEDLVYKVPSIHSGSYNLSTPSSIEFPEVWEEGSDEDIPFRNVGSKVSHALHIVQLWDFGIYCHLLQKKRFLWWWLNKIYEYTRMMVGKGVIFGFPLGSWPIYSKVLDHLRSCQGWVPSHGEGSKSNQILVD